MPLVEVFDLVACQQETGVQGTNDVEDGVRGVGGEMHAFVRRRVPLRIECGNVLSQEFSTGLHGSVNWPQCVGRVTTAKNGNQHLEDDEGSVELRKRILEKMRTTWRKKTVSKMALESLENVWKTAWSNLRE